MRNFLVDMYYIVLTLAALIYFISFIGNILMIFSLPHGAERLPYYGGAAFDWIAFDCLIERGTKYYEPERTLPD